MAVTEVDQLLSDFLDQSKAGATTKAIAFITVSDKELNQIALCRYLADNEAATDEQILAAARRIAAEE